MKAKILVIDDEKNILKSLSGILSDEGYSVVSADSGEEGVLKMEEGPIDTVLLDIWLPGMDGLEVLGEMKKAYPHVPVIMISGHGTIGMAVKAVKDGAFDFLEKPLSMERVTITVARAVHQKRIEDENRELKKMSDPVPYLIGFSASMKEVKKKIDSAAPTDAAVLIFGENGSGKEVAARTIHIQSERNQGPFVAVNCAAVPEGLIESELFGHEKGAFTGADRRRVGKVEISDGGTLFLDEIGDMSYPMQAKLLRFLEEKKIERIGGEESILVDTRIICATNKELASEIKSGNFREDLYFRINVIPVELPPLRKRKEDIPYLARHFMKQLATFAGRPEKELTKEGEEKLLAHSWPGNVRELKNTMERIMILFPEEVVSGEAVLSVLGHQGISDLKDNYVYPDSYRDALSEFERSYLLSKLRENRMNISKTAGRIGIDRSSIHRKMKSLGIDPASIDEDNRE